MGCCENKQTPSITSEALFYKLCVLPVSDSHSNKIASNQTPISQFQKQSNSSNTIQEIETFFKFTNKVINLKKKQILLHIWEKNNQFDCSVDTKKHTRLFYAKSDMIVIILDMHYKNGIQYLDNVILKELHYAESINNYKQKIPIFLIGKYQQSEGANFCLDEKKVINFCKEKDWAYSFCKNDLEVDLLYQRFSQKSYDLGINLRGDQVNISKVKTPYSKSERNFDEDNFVIVDLGHDYQNVSQWDSEKVDHGYDSYGVRSQGNPKREQEHFIMNNNINGIEIDNSVQGPIVYNKQPDFSLQSINVGQHGI